MGNNGTIVPPALIKRRIRDVVRRSGEGRWVRKGQKREEGGLKEKVHVCVCVLEGGVGVQERVGT